MTRFYCIKHLMLACLLTLGIVIGLQAEETPPTFLSLKGFLGKDQLAQPTALLRESSSPHTLLLEVNSSSGDLAQVLEFAKVIHQLKKLQQLKVIVYLQESALGPAAILPFLADELNSSLFAAWGDIPLGTEGALPANILRNRVQSLIDPQSPHAQVLYVLADAMSDPSLQVVDDQGWRITAAHQDHLPGQLISTSGQTLVINQNQLLELGLAQGVFPFEELEKRYHLRKQEKKPLSEELSSQNLEKRLQQFIPFDPKGPNRVGYLYIGDHESSISESTWLYVKQGLEFYKKQRPIFIILELNTPGGEVFAAQKISDALKEMDTQFNIPIVAFINNWAISAGAMLAYSSRFITVVKDGSMGAAEPVLSGEGGKVETASEKVNSALRTDFANRARFFDRNPLIAEAMVDKDMILVLRHGKVTRLEKESQIRLTGPHPDKLLSFKGKLLTLNAEQMLEDGVADFVLSPTKLAEVTPSEKKAGEWPADKMLLFQAPFFSSIPQATIQAYQMDWKTRLFVFLATPLVSSLLFMGLLIGGYMEISQPGFGLPGFVAAICLFLIVLSSFALQIADVLELILLLMGLALLLLELFIFPTAGLLGIVGIILFVFGLFGMLLPSLGSVSFEQETQTLNAAGQYLLKRLAWLCGSFIVSFFVIAGLARYMVPRFGGWNRLVLVGHEQEASKGFIAGELPAELPQPGTKAKVFATLRPAGKIEIEGCIYDAISTGALIEAGQQIKVVRLEGNMIVVHCDEGD